MVTPTVALETIFGAPQGQLETSLGTALLVAYSTEVRVYALPTSPAVKLGREIGTITDQLVYADPTALTMAVEHCLATRGRCPR